MPDETKRPEPGTWEHLVSLAAPTVRDFKAIIAKNETSGKPAQHTLVELFNLAEERGLIETITKKE
jgi:hypothetical protein